MIERTGVKIYSEIGKLRRVIVHRPGPELDNLTPPTMKNYLFEDLPDYVAAGKEHDAFVDLLRQSGTEIFYTTDLLSETLADPETRRLFLNDFLRESHVFLPSLPHLFEYLQSMEDIQELVRIVMAGLRREEYRYNGTSLDLLDRKKLLLFDLMPNLYFTRDPMSVLGRGLSTNCMWAENRHRESLLPHYVIRYHPLFNKSGHYFSRHENASLEGGDILVLSEEVIAVGVSQRTETAAVKTLAYRVLTSGDSFQHVLVFMIPERRAFMHLDTVFTMLDRDIFTIHPEIEGPLEVYDMTVSEGGTLEIKNLGNNLSQILKTYLRLQEVELVRCGGNSTIDAQREQWNDGANALAIAPGEVIAYDRNRITNQLIRQAGVRVHEIAASELSRGRGGPRCMTQPLWRDDLD